MTGLLTLYDVKVVLHTYFPGIFDQKQVSLLYQAAIAYAEVSTVHPIEAVMSVLLFLFPG